MVAFHSVAAAVRFYRILLVAVFALSSVATAVHLVQFLSTTSLSVATIRASSPLAQLLLQSSLGIVSVKATWPQNQEVITDDQQSRRACVYGAPKMYDQWTIYYHEVKPPSQFPNHFVLDPAWVERHQTVGDTDHFSLGTTWVPWAENRCQYTCNARKNCVSFVGYQAKHSTPDSGEFYCHFFDTLIQPENIIQQPSDEPYKITHAYNRLCDNETGI